MTYSDKLKDPRWQRCRLDILNRDDFRCRLCHDIEATLAVHHMCYTAKDPWDEPRDNMITVCDNCHEIIKHCKTPAQRKSFDIILTATDHLYRSLCRTLAPAATAHKANGEVENAYHRAKKDSVSPAPTADEDLFS